MMSYEESVTGKLSWATHAMCLIGPLAILVAASVALYFLW